MTGDRGQCGRGGWPEVVDNGGRHCSSPCGGLWALSGHPCQLPSLCFSSGGTSATSSASSAESSWPRSFVAVGSGAGLTGQHVQGDGTSDPKLLPSSVASTRPVAPNASSSQIPGVLRGAASRCFGLKSCERAIQSWSPGRKRFPKSLADSNQAGRAFEAIFYP